MDGIDIPVRGVIDAQSDRFGQGTRKVHKPSWFKRNLRMLSFLLAVVAPTALVGTYYFAFAADQYVSETKFVVRGPTAQAQGMLSSLLQTTGLTRAEEDTYAVQDYIMSRDALRELVQSQEIKAVFDRPEADRLARFPLFAWQTTFEHLFDYYLKHVDVTMDSTSGVSTLTVRTFRADDSARIANAELKAGEDLVNRMNARQRDNALRDARKEVDLAESHVEDVATQVAEFRNREALLDPTKQSVPMLASINDLQTLLSRTNLQLAQLTTSTPRSPLIADLRRRAEALQGQITEARTKITGTDTSLVPKIAAFDMLELRREFADKQLASAIASLEASRIQAEHQQLYLETIVQPDVADYAAYPKRIASIAITFASLLGLYIMIGLLIAGAREHRIS